MRCRSSEWVVLLRAVASLHGCHGPSHGYGGRANSLDFDRRRGELSVGRAVNAIYTLFGYLYWVISAREYDYGSMLTQQSTVMASLPSIGRE